MVSAGAALVLAAVGALGAAKEFPASPVPRVLGRGASGVVSSEPHQASVSFDGPGRIVRFEHLPPNAPRLVVVDRQTAFEFRTDARGVLFVAGPSTAGDHAVSVLPPDGTRMMVVYPPVVHRRERSKGRLAAAILVVVSLLFWGAWKSGALPEAVSDRRSLRKTRTGPAASLAAGAVFAGAIATYAVRVWTSPVVRHEPPAARSEQLFAHSQFIIGWKDPDLRVMTDQGIYAWAGWLYAHGTRPDLVNPEHPPLGKYLLGAAKRATGASTAATFAAGLVAIAGLAVLARGVLASWPLALLGASIAAAGKLISAYTEDTYLEIFVLALAVWGIAAVGGAASRAKPSLSPILALDVLLGTGMAIKWSFAVFGLVVVVTLLCAARVRSAAAFLAGLPLAAAVYALSYARSLSGGLSPSDFLAFQAGIASRWKWINAGVKPSAFGLWRILFLGIPDYSPDRVPCWSPFWPLAGLLAIAGTIVAFRRRNIYAIAAGVWFVGQMLFFTAEPSWERYLVPVLPVAVVLSLFLFRKSRPALVAPILYSPVGDASHSGWPQGHASASAPSISILAQLSLQKSWSSRRTRASWQWHPSY